MEALDLTRTSDRFAAFARRFNSMGEPLKPQLVMGEDREGDATAGSS
jgi:hypothetical protein